MVAHMFPYGYRTIAGFFFKKAWRTRRNRFFVFLCLLPIVIMGIMALVNLFSPRLLRDIKFFLGEMSVQIYFLLNVQLMSLFFGTSVIAEEVEEKTLVYLTPRPVSRSAIILGKFSAYLAVPLVMTNLGLLLSFIVYFQIADFGIPVHNYVLLILNLWGIAFLHLLGYSSLFLFLGSIMNKPVIAGIVFVFGWENLVRMLPGISRYLTLNHYLRPLLPSFNYSGKPQFLAFRVIQPTATESVVVIVLLSLICIGLATVIFNRKEVVLSDSI